MALIWLDFESTGLRATKHHLLEVACIATDDAFNELGRFERVIYWDGSRGVIKALANAAPSIERMAAGDRPTGVPGTADSIKAMYLRMHRVDEVEPVVADMHQKNGLWERSMHGEALATVEQDLADFIAAHAVKQPQLAGSTISFDRGFIEHHMPAVEKLLHYRNLDVSSLNELAKRFFPDIYATRPTIADKAHRGMADIEASLALANYYVAKFGSAIAPGLDCF